ncbi:MAG: bifunctional diaminohydroxyphosphoribosylaminopyrimidine deaminase/5-amino-6-(5-phosphoribosylamino)uracil reductase RibD [Bacteroidia bacterium]|nr:bifunctional diaminohydroxyphosphoribosylaminopyrimidine deaminase/5-amino-6-(5-phosphoribosylamino)uracil reductase RibD [Bacteroidia bacterium]MDW8134552.1 bifunctional diaminohydroxyphosphoribosylaminopyrimidine deaminase/5-amino-6-(5-phosphoribosylamino)uracil reductase RibD [Bacteroidia bacterium]
MRSNSSLSPLDEVYLKRALQLAQRAFPSKVEPNPPVGAVIAVGETIIGEGYHHYFAGPHAEIEALQSVRETHRLPQATMYITLEPCCHSRKKTPPCVPAIVKAGIRRVVIGTIDPNPHVRGEGIKQLEENGIEVLLAPDPKPFRKILRHFYTNLRYHRPYITLKWAQTAGPTRRYPFTGGIIGSLEHPKWPISGFWGRVWAHRLRATHSHIAVGYRTWQLDKPALTTRTFPGGDPQRIVFCNQRCSLVESEEALFYPLSKINRATLRDLYEKYRVGSLLVEGGATTLNAFLAAGIYDEVHIIVSYHAEPSPSGRSVLAPTWPPLQWRKKRLSPTEELWIARKKET